MRSWRNWQTRYFEGVVFTRRMGSSPIDRTICMVSSDRFGYVLPFEFISVFLLACIIGGIVISRKE